MVTLEAWLPSDVWSLVLFVCTSTCHANVLNILTVRVCVCVCVCVWHVVIAYCPCVFANRLCLLVMFLRYFFYSMN